MDDDLKRQWDELKQLDRATLDSAVYQLLLDKRELEEKLTIAQAVVVEFGNLLTLYGIIPPIGCE